MTLQKKLNQHTPVLLPEVLALLDPRPNQTYLDLTTGAGGHAKAIIDYKTKATLVDRDPSLNLSLQFKGARVLVKDFCAATKELLVAGESFDLILADLGLSSIQLDDPERGFSFQSPGLLDMRLNQDEGQPLGQRLATLSLEQLTKILLPYEPRARAVARSIKQTRPKTTAELSKAVKRVVRARKKHPATKTFLALRVWMNDELGQLACLLESAPLLLAPGGRLAIISFQSLEDKLVKETLTNLGHSGYDSEYNLLTKKPITPSQAELDFNPRSRSAKLRGLQRK